MKSRLSIGFVPTVISYRSDRDYVSQSNYESSNSPVEIRLFKMLEKNFVNKPLQKVCKTMFTNLKQTTTKTYLILSLDTFPKLTTTSLVVFRS